MNIVLICLAFILLGGCLHDYQAQYNAAAITCLKAIDSGERTPEDCEAFLAWKREALRLQEIEDRMRRDRMIRGAMNGGNTGVIQSWRDYAPNQRQGTGSTRCTSRRYGGETVYTDCYNY